MSAIDAEEKRKLNETLSPSKLSEAHKKEDNEATEAPPQKIS
jgi:hypothetical protein